MATYNDFDSLRAYLSANSDGGNKFSGMLNISKGGQSDLVDVIDYPRLPIDDFREEIEKSIENNQILIITAETGSGKTTETPLFFLEKGYNVIVTQPRRIAVESVPEYVCKKTGIKLGGLIGFRHGIRSLDSFDTKLLYCTDGLQMVREVMGQGLKGKSVLIIDEVHEWNTNIETLLAWSKQKIRENPDFKVVIMSATFDSSSIQEYFSGGNKDIKSKLVEVPGNVYPVFVQEESESDYLDSIVVAVEMGNNVLAFRPGKKEIYETISEIEKIFNSRGIKAVVLPLHSELSSDKQQLIFKNYSIPKVIVSTNIAQTSITVDDIDVVVDDGKQKQKLVDRNGIEGIFTTDISRADCIQRKGRAGRCKEGRYIFCSDKNIDVRDEYSKPEIERVRLDQLVLRLFDAGYDPTTLDFFHQPPKEQLDQAKKSLIELGALTIDGNITDIGRYMSELPVDVHIARMIVESFKYGCVDDVVKIASCMQVSGIIDRNPENQNEISYDEDFKKERQSDLIFQLQLFKLAEQIEKSADRYGFRNGEKNKYLQEMFEKKKISLKKYKQALLVYEDINKNINSKKDKLENIFHDNIFLGNTRDFILKSVLSGMRDNIFVSTWNEYKNINNINDVYRQIDRNSVINGNGYNIVCGIPWNISIKTKNRYGLEIEKILNLVNMCTGFDLNDFKKYFPDIEVKEEILDGNPRRNVNEGYFEIQVSVNIKDISAGYYKVEYIPNEEKKDEILKSFCQKLYLRDFTTPNIDFSNLFNDIGKIVSYNKELIEKTKQYNILSSSSYPILDDAYIIDNFFKILKNKDVYSIKAFIEGLGKNYNIDDFKIDLEKFYGKDLYEKIKSEFKPDIDINGNNYQISFDRNSSRFVNIEIEDIINLSEDDIKTIQNYLDYFRINSYILSIVHGSPLQIKNDIRNFYQERMLIKFKNENKNTIGIIPFENPKLPDKKIYCSLTGAIAYPYFEWIDGSNCNVLWSDNQIEANKNNEIFFEEKKNNDEKNAFESKEFNLSYLVQSNKNISINDLINIIKNKKIIFISIDLIDHETLFAEFDIIEKLLKFVEEIPGILDIDSRIDENQKEISKIDLELPNLINQRDLSSGDKKNKLKLKVVELQDKRRDLKSSREDIIKIRNDNELLIGNYYIMKNRYESIENVL